MADKIPITGKVTGVYTGNTLTLLNESGATVKLRVAAIEPFPDDHLVGYDSRARQELSAFAFGKTATVIPQYVNADGYTVGRMLVEGQDLSAKMVKCGMACVDRKQAGDTAPSDLQESARATHAPRTKSKSESSRDAADPRQDAARHGLCRP